MKIKKETLLFTRSAQFKISEIRLASSRRALVVCLYELLDERIENAAQFMEKKRIIKTRLQNY